MYRISKDKRSFISCTMIYRAMVSLVKSGVKLESISVTDLSRESTISRGTFYRHFDQVIDVLVWACDVEIANASEKFLLASNLKLFNLYFFRYWYDHPDLLEIVFATGRSDIFLNSLEAIVFSYTAEVLLKSSKLSMKKRRFVTGIWTSVLWMILKQWIEFGKVEDPVELTKIAIHNMLMPQ